MPAILIFDLRLLICDGSSGDSGMFRLKTSTFQRLSIANRKSTIQNENY